MDHYSGTERRSHTRVCGHFIVSYRILEEDNNIDLTQTKNISLGGMLLTTNKKFDAGMSLALEIRLPFDAKPIKLVGKVVESKEITKGLIYDTRLNFITIEGNYKDTISKTIDFYVKRGKT